MKKIGILLFCLYGWLLAGEQAGVQIYHLQKSDRVRLDGRLNEPFWQKADSITGLTMVEPREGFVPSQQTTVRIAMDEQHIYLGVRCVQNGGDAIVYISRIRDSRMGDEDYIKFIFDTNLDRRTGYIFAINPAGTRYDALVANFGEQENRDWDASWEARTAIEEWGWSAEIHIPIQTLAFAAGLQEWGFNIERRIQGHLEIDRWAGIKQDYRLSQVQHAGRIGPVPEFNNNLGLTTRASLLSSSYKELGQSGQTDLKYSLDFSQKISSDVAAQLTLKTDFAETEVDARRTNLTRFPLFFPEKRRFFLEGADIFSFGLGLDKEVIPFYSRRIGLYEEQKIPITVGAKLNGRVGNTNFGALVTQTEEVDTLNTATRQGVLRVKQNIGEESSAGFIGTFGRPVAGEVEWLLGSDFTYQNSRFLGDKNFLVGAMGTV